MQQKPLVCVIMIVMISLGWADNSVLKKTVYSPKKGVVCDIELNYCVNSKGISLQDSKLYLGDSAYNYAKQVKQNLQEVSAFALSNGVFCNIRNQRCYVDAQDSSYKAGVSEKMTYFIFGK